MPGQLGMAQACRLAASARLGGLPTWQPLPTHIPRSQPSWTCYTEDGKTAAKKSNIHYRSWRCSGFYCNPPQL